MTLGGWKPRVMFDRYNIIDEADLAQGANTATPTAPISPLSSFAATPGQVAQLVEQRTENPRVGSSILPLAIRRDPSLPANRRSRMVDPNQQAVVVVHGRGDGFAQEITAGRHRLIADEPVSAGGTDRGLGPYDLLLAGLGA